MIDEAHKQFQRWAAWVLQPVAGDGPQGYGKNILQKIVEGKGLLMPGAPTSAKGRLYVPSEALVVEAYLKTVDRQSRMLIKTFYLEQYQTVEWKAKRLRLPLRTLYDRLDRLHQGFLTQQHSDQL